MICWSPEDKLENFDGLGKSCDDKDASGINLKMVFSVIIKEGGCKTGT